MATIIADSLKDYGVYGFGGRCHDLLGTRYVRDEKRHISRKEFHRMELTEYEM